MCSDAPDTSGVNAAAVKSAELGDKAFAWYQKAYDEQAPLRADASKRAALVSDAQLRAMDTSTNIALESSNRAKQFQPIEDAILHDAMGAGSEAEQEQAAGRVATDVGNSFAGARGQASRNLTRGGFALSDADRAAIESQMASDEALATAGGMTRARQQVITLADAKRKDAAAIGRGMQGTQATQAGIALTQGNSAVGNAQVPISIAQQGTNQAAQGYNLALNSANQSGNLYGRAASMEAGADASDNQATSGLAGAAMTAAAIF